jgi:hypothetical protein
VPTNSKNISDILSCVNVNKSNPGPKQGNYGRNMNIYIAVTSSLLLGFAPVSPALGISTVYDLKWLAGCWESVGGEPGSGEQWSIPAGDTLFGVSRTIRNGKTVAHEFMQIRGNGTDKIEFIANPSGQEGASFLMKTLTENEVVFENLAHDFPQRVIYRSNDPNKLTGRIEGQVNDESRAVNFPLERVNCRPAMSR